MPFARKREKGQRISGKPPYGFAFTPDGKLTEVASEQAVLAEVRKVANGGGHKIAENR